MSACARSLKPTARIEVDLCSEESIVKMLYIRIVSDSSVGDFQVLVSSFVDQDWASSLVHPNVVKSFQPP